MTSLSTIGTINILATTNQIVCGVTNTTTLSFPAPSGSMTLAFPSTADTIVGRATTDTLTNKTLSLASNTLSGFTSGSLLYHNGTTISQNNASLFWDNGNTRMMVGANSVPAAVTGGVSRMYLESNTDLDLLVLYGTAMSSSPMFTMYAPAGGYSTNNGTGKMFQAKVAGEGSGRFMFYTDGMGAGGGAGTRDIYLYRSAANQWLIDSDKAGASNGNLRATGLISALNLTASATTNQIVMGTTNTTTISAPAPVSSIVLTLPSATDTLIGRATTDTLTNKTWNGSLITGTYGGTGVNNGSSTITLAGNLVTSGVYALTLTTTATTNVTLPTSGTLVNSAVTTLSSLASIGTITTGVWNATDIALSAGGTNASLTAVNGGVVYSTASAMAITAAGTQNQVLLSNGSSAPTWSDNSLPYYRKEYEITMLSNPNNSDWKINALAPSIVDSINASLNVRDFVNGSETGAGFQFYIPTGYTTMVIYYMVRGTGTSGTAGFKLYYRQLASATTISSTWAGTNDGNKVLTTISIPANTNFTYFTQTIAFSTFSPAITSNKLYQFELTRPSGDTPATHLYLSSLTVELR